MSGKPLHTYPNYVKTIKTKYMITKKNNLEYGKWIGSYDWDLYVVIRNEGGTTKNMVHTISNRIFKKNENMIDLIVYVGERDKGKWNNYHINILIKTKDKDKLIENLKKTNKSKTFYVGGVDTNLGVSYYVSKYISTPTQILDKDNKLNEISDFERKYGNDIEWDILYPNYN